MNASSRIKENDHMKKELKKKEKLIQMINNHKLD